MTLEVDTLYLPNHETTQRTDHYTENSIPFSLANRVGWGSQMGEMVNVFLIQEGWSVHSFANAIMITKPALSPWLFRNPECLPAV